MEKPAAVIHEIASICAPILCTATPTAPQRAATVASVSENMEKSEFCRQTGSPNKTIFLAISGVNEYMIFICPNGNRLLKIRK